MTKIQQARTIAQNQSLLRLELIARLEHLLPADGYQTHLGMVSVSRSSRPTDAVQGMYEPTFCVVAQGTKVMEAGNETYTYDPATFLLTSVPMPVAIRVAVASAARPYLCVGLRVDPAVVGSLLAQPELSSTAGDTESSLAAVDVCPLDVGLLDAVVRLIRVLDSPRDAAVLAPLLEREIIYRLLTGPQGARLRQLAPAGSATRRIAQAIDWLRRHLTEPVRIPALARRVGMSPSSLHHYFRAITGKSPLQYLKQMRLAEARRLLEEEHVGAASAGFAVGYNDASQFTREYRRSFGAPPMRDLRERRPRS